MLVQIPPLTLAVPNPPGSLPTKAKLLLRVPALRFKTPVPKLPTIREEPSVQEPPLTVAVPWEPVEEGGELKGFSRFACISRRMRER